MGSLIQRRVENLPVLTSLHSDTRYYYAVEAAGDPKATRRGAFRTFPAGPASFTFAFAAFARTGSSSAVFSSVRGQSPIFFMNTGDLHFENIGANDPGPFRAAYQTVLNSPAQADLYRLIPMV